MNLRIPPIISKVQSPVAASPTPIPTNTDTFGPYSPFPTVAGAEEEVFWLRGIPVISEFYIAAVCLSTVQLVVLHGWSVTLKFMLVPATLI